MTAESRPIIRPFRKAGWPACISSSGAPAARRRSRPGDARSGDPRHRPHLGRRVARSGRSARRRRQRSPPSRRSFPTAIAKTFTADEALADAAASPGSRRQAAPHRLLPAPRREPDQAALKIYHLGGAGCPVAPGADPGEHGLQRHQRADLRDRPAPKAEPRLPARHGAEHAAARHRSRAMAAAARGHFLAVWHGASRMTASTRSS